LIERTKSTAHTAEPAHPRFAVGRPNRRLPPAWAGGLLPRRPQWGRRLTAAATALPWPPC